MHRYNKFQLYSPPPPTSPGSPPMHLSKLNVFKIYNPRVQLLLLMYTRCRTMWSMVNPLGATLLRKTYSPSPRNRQMPVALHLCVKKAVSHSFLRASMLTVWILRQSYTDICNCSEFMSEAELSGPEDTAASQSSLTSGPYTLPISSSNDVS